MWHHPRTLSQEHPAGLSLLLWGRRDEYFDLDEVMGYHRALEDLEIHVYDAGHFLLETHARDCVRCRAHGLMANSRAQA